MKDESSSFEKNILKGCLTVFILGFLAQLTIQNFLDYHPRAYDASAKAEGRNAKFAVDVYHTRNGIYTSDLDILLSVDKNLTADHGVTFKFHGVSESGYTILTRHAKGKSKNGYKYTHDPR